MNKIARKKILPAGRRAGVGLHLVSLPGPYGIGDIGDSALSFIEALSDMHVWV
jgi:4-alpha-glucanotransferase